MTTEYVYEFETELMFVSCYFLHQISLYSNYCVIVFVSHFKSKTLRFLLNDVLSLDIVPELHIVCFCTPAVFMIIRLFVCILKEHYGENIVG